VNHRKKLRRKKQRFNMRWEARAAIGRRQPDRLQRVLVKMEKSEAFTKEEISQFLFEAKAGRMSLYQYANVDRAKSSERNKKFYRKETEEHIHDMGAVIQVMNEYQPGVTSKEEDDEVTPSVVVDAVQRGDQEAVRKLVDEFGPAVLNKPDSEGIYPLTHAYVRDDIQMVEFLIDKGANPNVELLDGCTPLHFVASKGSPRLMSKLIDSGQIDLNQQSDNGSTALHLATLRHDDEGVTPADLARDIQRSDATSGPADISEKSAEEGDFIGLFPKDLVEEEPVVMSGTPKVRRGDESSSSVRVRPWRSRPEVKEEVSESKSVADDIVEPEDKVKQDEVQDLTVKKESIERTRAKRKGRNRGVPTPKEPKKRLSAPGTSPPRRARPDSYVERHRPEIKEEVAKKMKTTGAKPPKESVAKFTPPKEVVWPPPSDICSSWEQIKEIKEEDAENLYSDFLKDYLSEVAKDDDARAEFFRKHNEDLLSIRNVKDMRAVFEMLQPGEILDSIDSNDRHHRFLKQKVHDWIENGFVGYLEIVQDCGLNIKDYETDKQFLFKAMKNRPMIADNILRDLKPDEAGVTSENIVDLADWIQSRCKDASDELKIQTIVNQFESTFEGVGIGVLEFRETHLYYNDFSDIEMLIKKYFMEKDGLVIKQMDEIVNELKKGGKIESIKMKVKSEVAKLVGEYNECKDQEVKLNLERIDLETKGASLVPIQTRENKNEATKVRNRIQELEQKFIQYHIKLRS